MNQVLSPFHNCQKDIKSNGRLVTDQIRGEIFCQECGLVLKERIRVQDFEDNVYSPERYLTSRLEKMKK